MRKSDKHFFLRGNFVLAFYLSLFYTITLISSMKEKISLMKALSITIYCGNFPQTKYTSGFKLMLYSIKSLALIFLMFLVKQSF